MNPLFCKFVLAGEFHQKFHGGTSLGGLSIHEKVKKERDTISN